MGSTSLYRGRRFLATFGEYAALSHVHDESVHKEILLAHALRSSAVALALSGCLAALAGCGPQQLAPPSAPRREAPVVDVPPDAPAPGTGRVFIDAAGDKAKVVEITGAVSASAGRYRATIVGFRPLCTTPCVVDLPYGSHPIALQSTSDPTRQSEATLEVGPRQKVFRHALGERKDGGALRTVGGTLIGLGAVTAITGAVLWGTGALLNSSSASGSGAKSGLEGTGQVITGIGAVGIVFGLPFFLIDRPTERPGNSTEWTVPGPTAPPSNAPVAPGSTHL